MGSRDSSTSASVTWLPPTRSCPATWPSSSPRPPRWSAPTASSPPRRGRSVPRPGQRAAAAPAVRPQHHDPVGAEDPEGPCSTRCGNGTGGVRSRQGGLEHLQRIKPSTAFSFVMLAAGGVYSCPSWPAPATSSTRLRTATTGAPGAPFSFRPRLPGREISLRQFRAAAVGFREPVRCPGRSSFRQPDHAGPGRRLRPDRPVTCSARVSIPRWTMTSVRMEQQVGMLIHLPLALVFPTWGRERSREAFPGAVVVSGRWPGSRSFFFFFFFFCLVAAGLSVAGRARLGAAVRFATVWLPIPPGYVALRSMRHHQLI